MRTLPLLIAILATTTLGQLGCSGPAATSGEHLRDHVTRYNESVRWQRFEAASEFVPEEKRARFLSRYRDTANDLRILEYGVEDVTRIGRDRAQVTVRYEWIRHPSNTVETTYLAQEWALTDESTKWLLLDSKETQRKIAKPRPF